MTWRRPSRKETLRRIGAPRVTLLSGPPPDDENQERCTDNNAAQHECDLGNRSGVFGRLTGCSFRPVGSIDGTLGLIEHRLRLRQPLFRLRDPAATRFVHLLLPVTRPLQRRFSSEILPGTSQLQVRAVIRIGSLLHAECLLTSAFDRRRRWAVGWFPTARLLRGRAG